jgi:plasmid stabilization system protein ParE
MKLRFTPRAIENIAAIADCIRALNPAASQRVRAAIYDSLQDLILFPHAGRIQQTAGVRKFVTPVVDVAAEEQRQASCTVSRT